MVTRLTLQDKIGISKLLATTFSFCYGFKSYLPINQCFQSLTPLATLTGFKSLKYLLIGLLYINIYVPRFLGICAFYRKRCAF